MDYQCHALKWRRPNGEVWVVSRTPFDENFVRWIKNEIPTDARLWSQSLRAWLIADRYKETLKRLTIDGYGYANRCKACWAGQQCDIWKDFYVWAQELDRRGIRAKDAVKEESGAEPRANPRGNGPKRARGARRPVGGAHAEYRADDRQRVNFDDFNFGDDFRKWWQREVNDWARQQRYEQQRPPRTPPPRQQQHFHSDPYHASGMDIRDAARVLQISISASPVELKTAFRKQALEAHPDRGGSNEKMALINAAYEALVGIIGRA
jgi:hypothetical protein